jgi:hypothetical protein
VSWIFGGFSSTVPHPKRPLAGYQEIDMATAPNPARIHDYEARLAGLMELRAHELDGNNDHKVKNLNRQIQTQLKWIASARSAGESK